MKKKKKKKNNVDGVVGLAMPIYKSFSHFRLIGM